jgi:cyclopropane-fatty-acyl-phospholipid synthase
MNACVAERLAPLLVSLLGPRPPVAIAFWDGSGYGPRTSSSRIVIRSPDALARIVQSPGELGLARAYVAGDLDVEGDIFDLLRLREVREDVRLSAREWMAAVRSTVSVGALRLRPMTPPPEEARLGGRLHSRKRDADAISHHYDVSNEFYRIVLGPTMTYSCAYFSSAEQSLDDAQIDKIELICRKLRLRPGERLLDVGCGWGTLAIHAAQHFGAQVVGVTLSQRQADLAAKRVAEAGMAHRVEIRVQDERDVDDGPYDAVSSVGMFEHVGASRLQAYFTHLFELLRPGGRLLNHGISRPAGQGRSRFRRKSFIDSYVFPDGELHEVGAVVTSMQESGFEVRDLESLREHYALTLRRWVSNLEAGQQDAIAHTSDGRYRVWRLYMAACAVNFELGNTQVHQVLGIRPDGGASGVPLRRADIVLP